MNKVTLSKAITSPNTLRLALFILAALGHGALILFLAFKTPAVPPVTEEPLRVMKLADLMEVPPPLSLPPPPPPPPPQREETVPENAVESIAENFIETEEVPEEQVLVPPATIQTPAPAVTGPATATEEVYLRPHQVSDPPRFNDADILKALRYPPIAQRSGIEGTVYLELFIDREGAVRRITVLKEDPPGRGFADAAVRAFEGLHCVPAQANGQNVSVRYRYPVSFKLR
jgi:protein TonB